MKRAYFYTVSERLWHWLQAGAILTLIITGLLIHWSDEGSIYLTGIRRAHYIAAFILMAVAAFGLLYHALSGHLQQFLPEPNDFMTMAFRQAVYYARDIFSGKRHPFNRNPETKLNPLQKLTYLVILNLLLPLQVISGLLLLSSPYWLSGIEKIGGISGWMALHVLGAWLFGAFVIAHIYLTTTGHTPLAHIEAMITGWDYTDDPDDDLVGETGSEEHGTAA